MPLTPNFINAKLASLGYTDWVIHNEKIRYRGNIFCTPYIIDAQTNYAVERFATKNSVPEHEPFIGMSKLKLTDFVLLDIGANIGSYSIGSVHLGAKKVFAIEPGPLFDRMLKNIKLNELEKKITPLRVGLAKSNGKMRWYEDRNNPGNAHLLVDKADINLSKVTTHLSDDFIEVNVMPLNELCIQNKIDHIDIIKIDVEGMEWEVLNSGIDLIKSSLPTLVVETHRTASDMMGYDCLTPMFSTLYELGYKTYSHQKGYFEEFIYPNFDTDTFFIHQSKELI